MFTKNNKRNLDNALKKARGVLVRNGKLYIQFKEKNKHGYTRKSTKFRAEAVNVKLAYTKLIKIQDAIAKDEYDEEKFFGKKSNKTVYKTSIEKLVNEHKNKLLAQGNFTTSTIEHRISILNNFVNFLSMAKTIYLDKLTVEIINNYISERKKNLNQDSYRSYVSRVITFLIEYIKVYENLNEVVETLKLSKKTKNTETADLFVNNSEIKPFSEKEINKTQSVITVPQRRNFFLLLVLTGARLNELNALGWHNVNFNKKEIYIKRNWVKSTKTYKGPKNRSSDRTIHMIEPVFQILKEQYKITGHLKPTKMTVKGLNHQMMDEQVKFVFSKIIDSGESCIYVETPIDGHQWRKILKRADIPYRKLYQCRHTYAVMSILKEIPLKYIQLQMGHSSSKELDVTYSAVFPDGTEQYIERMKERFLNDLEIDVSLDGVATE